MTDSDARPSGDDGRDSGDDEDDPVDCPEPLCGISMRTRDEINTHLRWDHNRSENEAEAMLDAAGVAHAK